VYSDIINKNNYKIVAELGIGYGTHARYILTHNKDIQKLILIDPMKFYENDAFADDVQSKIQYQNMNNFDRLYELINQDLSFEKDKYTWIRKESGQITNEDIQDNYLDAIFIDGDHSYNAVINDLTKFWPKVRSGGQILGDDYYMHQVARAVNDFSNKIGVKFDLLYKQGTQHPIFRFHKP